ncbi:MAG: Rrf2 family transcriptional regulator [Desulfosudis oleivorans]|nr:Rrf2 family transcriptional regulator [Desulfosudis oleivorans]
MRWRNPPRRRRPYQMMQIKEISQREQISAKFLEQILLTLKNAGLLHSKMGVGGGYYLARSAQRDHPRPNLPRAGWTCGSDQMCQPDGV